MLLLALAALAVAVAPHRGAAQDPAGARVAPGSFDVVGEVLDATTGAPVVGAWVGLDGTDWGSITNGEGRFRIPDHVSGPLALRIERIGYQTLEWTGELDAPALVTIRLEQKAIVLEGLQVVTDRFRSRRRATATTVRAFEPNDLAVATERSAREFIAYRTMGMSPCDGRISSWCVYVRDRFVEPTVYIDEMPFPGGLDYLESFAPWEFHMIEIYGNGRHIRAYTPAFMERAAEIRLLPLPIFN